MDVINILNFFYETIIKKIWFKLRKENNFSVDRWLYQEFW